MSKKLTEAQRAILAQCNTPTGRIGWPLSVWEAPGGAKAACAPLIEQGLLRERRLGGYPGVQLTPEGRVALDQKGR